MRRLKRSKQVQAGFLSTSITLLCTLVHSQVVSAFEIDERQHANWRFDLNAKAVAVDNFYYRNNNGSSNSVGGIVLSPRAEFSRGNSFFRTDIDLGADLGAFTLSNKDNYLDYKSSISTVINLASAHALELLGSYRSDHDPFGQARTEGTLTATRELDKWNLTKYGAIYRWGRGTKSFLNIHTRFDFQDKEYETNVAQTRFLNYEKMTANILFQFRHSPKTTWLVELFDTSIEFDHNPAGQPSRDGHNQGLLLGARWLATSKTSGDIRIGIASRNFDDSSRSKLESNQWRIGVNWDPRQRTHIRLVTSRDFQESYRQNIGAVEETKHTFSWEELWNRAFSTGFAVSHRTQSFDRLNEDDVYWRGSIRFNKHLDAGFTIYAQIEEFIRESKRINLDFERTLGSVGFSVELN